MGTLPQGDSRIPQNAVPDEVFETPLFKMERFGRHVRINTSRSKEDHEKLIRGIVEHRPELLARATEIRNELQDLIHRHSSLELLAHLIAKNVLHNPDTYREYDSPLRPHFTEYIALLELRDPAYQYRTLEPPGEDVEKAQTLLEELFSTAIFHYQTEHISETTGSVPSKIQELRYSAIAHNIAVRSPAYHDHWREALVALFGTPAVAAWLGNRQLTISNILSCVDASESLMAHRLRNRIAMAKQEEEKVRQQVRQVRRCGAASGENAEILRNLAAQSGKKRRARLRWMLTEWAFFDLAGTWSLTPDALAEEARVSPQIATRFLQDFSVPFGQPPERDPWPRATHELQVAPFISYEEKFMLTAPHLLLWAIKPNIEARLRGESGAPWDSYEHARGEMLVEKAIECLRKAMPNSTSFQGLFYDFGGKHCELDGLLMFDQYLFLIEGKAGVASQAGRRGATKSIVSDLKDLVRDPRDQASRASEFIRSELAPVFSLKDGTKVPIDKAISPEIVTLSITLDDMGVFTSKLAEIQELGVLPKGELAWAIYLPDLMIVTEILQSPAQFLHYVGWRRSLFESKGVRCKDEVNWLGIYLKEGPERLTPPADFQFLTFSTYTTDLDEYFLFKMGQRSKPAARPVQWMPKEMSVILAQIGESNMWGHTRATNALLDLTYSERKKLGKILRRQGKAGNIDQVIEGTKTTVGLVSGQDDATCARHARKFAASSAKAAVVLSLAPKTRKLEGWGAEQLQRPEGAVYSKEMSTSA
ncbi:MAG TPA: hypothetical protein VNX26_03415 [Candidatus Acidoferrum sp.]|nr:hypothetical protein [Candidatus Acidoferrum sp.]